VDVRAGKQDFNTVFNTGEVDDVLLYGSGDWDMNRNGKAELRVSATPDPDSSATGYYRFYEALSGYDQVKQITIQNGHSGSIYTRPEGGLNGPVDMDGDSGDEYLYVDSWSTGNYDYHYKVQVRDKSSKKAVWEKTYDFPNAISSVSFGIADMNGDGTYEIIESLSWVSANTYLYHGKVDVRAGKQDFNTVFNTGEVDNVLLYGVGDWDMNRNGKAELRVNASPDPDSSATGYYRFYEALSGYDQIKQITVQNGHSGSVYGAELE